jgi:hypothetical protein
METRIFVLDSGVEIWKVTPSKSETTWSIETLGPLQHVSYLRHVGWVRDAGYSAPGEAVLEQRLNEDILVIQEKHRACRLWFKCKTCGDAEVLRSSTKLTGAPGEVRSACHAVAVVADWTAEIVGFARLPRKSSRAPKSYTAPRCSGQKLK